MRQYAGVLEGDAVSSDDCPGTQLGHPKIGEARHGRSRCRASLPLLGSNRDFPDLLSGVWGRATGYVQFVQLHLHGLGITVLGSLNEEYHQEGDDGRPRIDHQLPGIAEPK